MVIDPYKDAAVVKRMNELQQQNYRRGERNTTDNRGNPAYALTEDDKINCLDPVMQQIVRSEKQKIKKLEDYAQPFNLAIGIGESPPSYVVNITHPSWGHDRRSGTARIIDGMKNPDSWFRQQIDDMKKDLGYSETSPPPRTLDGKYLKMQEDKRKGYSVTDKRTKAPSAPLVCPEHGNELVRGAEAGTLVCTVVGCKKVARKKVRPSAFVKPVAEELKQEETDAEHVALVKDLENIQRHFGNAVEGFTDSSEPPINLQEALRNIAKQVPVGYATGVLPAPQREANDNMPELVAMNGRYYLVQHIAYGRESYVDITSVMASSYAVDNAPGQAQYTNIPPIIVKDAGTHRVITLLLK